MNKNKLNDALLLINGKIRSYETKILKKNNVDITQREFDYLGVIMSVESPRMKVLVEHMGVTKGTFSNTVKRMKEKGYLEFVSGEEDKRVRTIMLTEKSHDAIKIRNTIRANYFDKIVDVIGQEKVDDILESMKKIIEVL